MLLINCRLHHHDAEAGVIYPHFEKNIDNITIHILVLEKMAYVWRY
jgi:hypothetical protein